MKIMIKKYLILLGSIWLCVVSVAALADATKLEDLTIMAVGPMDGRAVVKGADGKLKVLKLGDTLPGTNAKLTQVLADKLVVEETVGKKGQPPVKQTAWIYKPSKPGAKTRVQRFDTQGPPPKLHQVKVAKPVKMEKSKAKKATAKKSHKKTHKHKASKKKHSTVKTGKDKTEKDKASQ